MERNRNPARRAICDLFVALVVLGLVACASGPRHAPVTGAAANQSHGQGSIYLFRGFLSVFSLGMDDFAEKIRAHGIEAFSYRYNAYREVADQIIHGDTNEDGRPLVLIGHSLGADAVILLAKILEAEGIKVPYLVTFDPFKPKPVPGNVARAVNFYQPGDGWSSRLEPVEGFGGILENIDVHDRKDLETEVNHFNIDEIDTIQAEIIEEIKKLAGNTLSPSKI